LIFVMDNKVFIKTNDILTLNQTPDSLSSYQDSTTFTAFLLAGLIALQNLPELVCDFIIL